VGVSAGGVTVDYYNAEVLSQNDYYAFGMMMPGRKYSVANTNYRYGFNGKERDNEVSGEGNQYDYGFRIYNPRLGRFLSVDPLTKEYPMLSPYPFAENQPIWAIDLDGLEKYIVINYLNKGGQIYKTEIRGIRSIDSKSAVNMQMKNSHGKSLTTKDVYVINQLANGKIREVGGKNNLNSEEQKLYNIAKNVSPENNSEGDENLPFENNISDALDTQNGTFSSKTFNQDKYEFFGITQKVTPLKIVSNPESNQPRQLFDNGHNDPLVAGNIIIRDVEKIVNDFKKANPKATDIKINVLFTTLNTNANFVNQIANRLEAIGIKTKIVTENNYRSAPVPGNTSSKHDFRFETKVTGIIKQ
jgi:RHS repeat-associated protein